MASIMESYPLGSEDLIELTHPREMLREDFLEPMALTPYQLSKALGIQQARISEILRGQRDISVETSLLLDRFFWAFGRLLAQTASGLQSS